MYTSFYHLSAKPFQLKPDPDFFFASTGHKRAMAYLEYGMAQEEGFIIITGEIGAGKTTLVRNLFKKIESEKIVAAQIANTRLNSEDTLRIVSAAFGLPFENLTKASLLIGIEKFLLQCNQNEKRALLVVDEAQNLSSHTIEELRMLSNYQTDKDGRLLLAFVLVAWWYHNHNQHQTLPMYCLEQAQLLFYIALDMLARETVLCLSHL